MSHLPDVGRGTITKEQYDLLNLSRPLTWGSMQLRRRQTEPETNTVDLTLMVESFWDGAE